MIQSQHIDNCFFGYSICILKVTFFYQVQILISLCRLDRLGLFSLSGFEWQLDYT